MQKQSRKAHLSVLEIIDGLLTFLSYNEQKKYTKAATAVKEATEASARLYHQAYRRSPERLKWFRRRVGRT